MIQCYWNFLKKMETISFTKRLFLYLINIILYTGMGFSSSLPFLLVLHIPIGWYIVISLGVTVTLGVILRYLLIRIMRGSTITSFFFGVRYIGVEEKELKEKQIIIRVINEAIPFLLLLDLFYLKINHTERGVIDRISDSFTIDLRRE